MTEPDIIPEAEAYCAKANISVSTLAVRALQNSRYFDRLMRKRQLEAEAVAKLRAYMAAHPPASTSEGTAP